jgi:hypothetical protein
MNLYNHYMQLILEGGNKAKSDPILKEYIKPTLDSFSKEFKKAIPGIKFEYSTLGSVGHKPQSGDLDLSLDISEFLNKEMKLTYKNLNKKDFEERFEKLKSKAKTASIGKLRSKALCQMLYEKLDSSNMKSYLVDSKASEVGSTIFFKYPQIDENGNETNKTVQVDLNIGNKEWLNFAYYSSPNIYSDDFKSKYGNLKGLHRTQLLVALFGAVGLTFDHTTGVKDKKTNEVIGKNPKEAINILNSKYKNLNLKESDVDNYASLMTKIRKLSKSEEEKVIKEYLTILHSAGYEDYEKPKDLESEIKKFGFVQKIRSSRQ